MSDVSELTIKTRPAVDIPLAIVAIGLTLLLAITAHGATATPQSNATPIPAVSAAPAAATAAPIVAPAQPKKDKGRG